MTDTDFEAKARAIASGFAHEYRKASMDKELMHDPELDWLISAIASALKAEREAERERCIQSTKEE